MSAIPALVTPRDRPALRWLAVGAGLGVLLVRSSASSMPEGPAVLIGLYAVLLWVSWDGLPDAAGTAPSRWLVLVLGIAAVGLAASFHAPQPPAPRTGWAVPLSVLAAVAEEAYFRGLLYRVMAPVGAAVAVAGTALAFAAVHVPAYGVAALPVDLGAGLLLSWQRWESGGWGVPAATHVVASLLVVVP
jgi:membrane protease YdiL (CAAX protease family)